MSIVGTTWKALTRRMIWAKQVLAWLFLEGWPGWVALIAPFLLFYLISLTTSNLEPRIRLTGMLMEAIGLGTVFLGLRDTRKLFDYPSSWGRSKRWLGRFPRFHRNVIRAAGFSSIGVFGSAGRVTVGVGPDASLEQRVAVLEKNLASIRSELWQAVDDGKRQHDEITGRLAVEVSERKQADDEVGKQLREATVGGLTLEITGVWFLGWGILLATASTEISEWWSAAG